MTIRTQSLNELLKNFTKPSDLTGENSILKQITKGKGFRTDCAIGFV